MAEAGRAAGPGRLLGQRLPRRRVGLLAPRPRAAGHEAPLDEHNHALAALRYLIASLDKRRLAKRPRSAPLPEPGAIPTAPAKTPEEKERAEQERLRHAQRAYLLDGGPHWTRWA